MVVQVKRKIASWLVPGYDKVNLAREIQVSATSEGMSLDQSSFKNNHVVRAQMLAAEELVQKA